MSTQQTSGPYAAGDPAGKLESAGYTGAVATKKPTSKWIKLGVPAAVVAVVVAAVLGGVLGSRAAKSNDDKGSSGGSSGSGSGGGQNNDADPSSSASATVLGRFATATNTEWDVPVYPSATNTAFSSPTFAADKKTWPEDPYKPGTPSPLSVRSDRPRLIAPSYKWEALPDLIRSDPYLDGWNSSIFEQATEWLNSDPVPYFMDGSSGILDVAREVKQRIKAFGYAWRMTKDIRWANRAWVELQNPAGDGPNPWGTAANRWNTGHFLDAAELSSAFGIAYDWFYDILTDAQKASLRATLVRYGLQPGLDAYNGASFGWWRNGVTGNWNCVCNGGLTVGALAILGDDTSGVARQLLGLTIDNAKENCAFGPSDDGTWAETPNYWYFGTTGHAEMASALLTATGSDYGLLTVNPDFALTGLAHMYGYGTTKMFDYGDHGPNKFSATANCLFLYAQSYNRPQYALFQRDRSDAAEPWSMFWYNPAASGAYWDGLELDHFFDDELDQWASMRSSWTDGDALYLAIKAGLNRDHANHNDLDVGDFVLDALGTRWAGELGSADYLAPGYFVSGAQNSVRWQYYRKMTEGQNTILVNQANQNVAAAPTVRHGSSETKQGSSTVFDVPKDSTAFWVTDMSSAYFAASTVKRGVRLLNGRRQVLMQDEIVAEQGVQWRMHTNATVTVDGSSATLSLDGETMKMVILSPPDGAAFSTSRAVRFASDPTPPAADQENPGVTVLIISLPAGSYNLQVLFNPQWPGMSDSDFVIPPTVALDDWTLTSHN